MFAIIALYLKKLIKCTFSKKEMESSDAKCDEIDLEKNTMNLKSKKEMKSRGPMKENSCKKCICIIRMALAFLMTVGIGGIFYIYSDQYILRHTVHTAQGRQTYKVAHCLSFPIGEFPDGRFLIICFTKHGNSVVSLDKTTQKPDVMRKSFDREKFN